MKPSDLLALPLIVILSYACVGECLRFHRLWGKCQDEIISAFWTDESPNCQNQKQLFMLSEAQQALCKSAKKQKDENALVCAAGRLWTEGFVVELWKTVLGNHYLLGFAIGTFIYVFIHALFALVASRGQTEMQEKLISAISNANARPIIFHQPQMLGQSHFYSNEQTSNHIDELIDPRENY